MKEKIFFGDVEFSFDELKKIKWAVLEKMCFAEKEYQISLSASKLFPENVDYARDCFSRKVIFEQYQALYDKIFSLFVVEE